MRRTAGSTSIGEWMQTPEWAKVPFVGLSATPWTKGLGKHYDDLIVATTTAELIDKGFLSPFRVFAPAHPDLSGVKVVAGDYHEGQLSEAMSKPVLVATPWRHGFVLARIVRRSALRSIAPMRGGSPTSSRRPACRPAMSTQTRQPTSGSASASAFARVRSRSSATSFA